MKIKPLHKNLLIKVIEETKDSMGIILPDEIDKRMEKAKVLEVGDQVENVKKGDTIIFKFFSLDEIKMGKETVYFLSEDNVLGIEK